MSFVKDIGLPTTNLLSEKNPETKYISPLNKRKIISPLKDSGMLGQSWKSCTLTLNLKAPGICPDPYTISGFAPTAVKPHSDAGSDGRNHPRTTNALYCKRQTLF